MSKVAGMQFIGVVESFFPRPKLSGDDGREAIWLRTMLDLLSPYEDDVLLEAANTIIRTRDPDKDGTMFPKPVECIAACDKAKDLKRVRSTPLLESQDAIRRRAERNQAWSAERVEFATELCESTAIGRRAAKEGWVLQLHDFCRENMRLPTTDAEVDVLVRSSANFRNLVARLTEDTDTLAQKFGIWGQSYLRKEEALADDVLSKEVGG